MSNNQSADKGPVLSAPQATEAITQVRRLSDKQPTTFIGRFKENLQFVRGRGSLEISIVLLARLRDCKPYFSNWIRIPKPEQPFGCNLSKHPSPRDSRPSRRNSNDCGRVRSFARPCNHL